MSKIDVKHFLLCPFCFSLLMFLDACSIWINQYRILCAVEHFGKTPFTKFVTISVLHCQAF